MVAFVEKRKPKLRPVHFKKKIHKVTKRTDRRCMRFYFTLSRMCWKLPSLNHFVTKEDWEISVSCSPEIRVIYQWVVLYLWKIVPQWKLDCFFSLWFLHVWPWSLTFPTIKLSTFRFCIRKLPFWFLFHVWSNQPCANGCCGWQFHLAHYHWYSSPWNLVDTWMVRQRTLVK